MSGRHFLKELDFSAAEWGSLLELAGELKAAKRSGCEVRRLGVRCLVFLGQWWKEYCFER